MKWKKKQQQATAMKFEATSNFKKDDLLAPRGGLDEINDSDLDMLLDDLQDVLNEEEISDSDIDMK